MFYRPRNVFILITGVRYLILNRPDVFLTKVFVPRDQTSLHLVLLTKSGWLLVNALSIEH